MFEGILWKHWIPSDVYCDGDAIRMLLVNGIENHADVKLVSQTGRKSLKTRKE